MAAATAVARAAAAAATENILTLISVGKNIATLLSVRETKSDDCICFQFEISFSLFSLFFEELRKNGDYHEILRIFSL